MSPHATNKRDVNMIINNNNNNNNNGLYPPPSLKINKDSHFIKKSPSSSSSSPSSSASSSTSSLVNAVAGSAGARPPQQQQQRHPVIIYTHSPKIIHTHPRDFMALVQKLTGLSRFDEDAQAPPPQQQQTPRTTKAERGEGLLEGEMMSGKGAKVVMRNEDNDSSSVITTEENCSSTNIINSNINVGVSVGVGGGGDGHVQMNSCFVPPNPYIGGIPVFTPNAADFFSSNPINHLFTI
ncbi:unnamed protein product [Prunus armeniaca]|uniref:VQ domain-containing protein n=1 Tax=Prunus armeniaca TaxID=36596 RepID=A0A6J5V0V8_PRUAR|nr:unnamed protein product [Prunus armeniaca]